VAVSEVCIDGVEDCISGGHGPDEQLADVLGINEDGIALALKM
jgi:hypothetical protein